MLSLFFVVILCIHLVAASRENAATKFYAFTSKDDTALLVRGLSGGSVDTPSSLPDQLVGKVNIYGTYGEDLVILGSAAAAASEGEHEALRQSPQLRSLSATSNSKQVLLLLFFLILR